MGKKRVDIGYNLFERSWDSECHQNSPKSKLVWVNQILKAYLEKKKNLNKEFVKNITKKTKEIETRKESYKKEIFRLAKVFDEIKELEDEKRKVEKLTAKAKRESNEKAVFY